MPEPEPARTRTRNAGELNEPQRRKLSVTCRYIDGLLYEIEHALHSATSESPFPRYVVDVTAEHAQAIQGHIRLLRAELLRMLAWQHLAPDPPGIPVTRSIATDLAFIDIALEELKPTHLRGCGPVPADAVDALNRAIHDLCSLVKDMDRYVRGTNESA